MKFTLEQITALNAPLSKANVRQRQHAGRILDYIEGWHAIDEANRIFGFDGWSRETLSLTRVSETPRKIGKEKRDGWGVSYLAHVRVAVFAGDRAIVREGTGSGHGIDADIGLAHEGAAKEAETDAMKRALVTFGNPFGLALYDKTQANVQDAPSAALGMALDAARACTTREALRACLARNRQALDPSEATTLKDECTALAKALPENEKEPA